jgi:Cys-rich protein (TIGR01571 family)
MAIFVLGPLAGLVHAGSLIGCCVRHDLRVKYDIPGNRFFDCCMHYWCGPCATCQEYEELTTRLGSPAPSS